MLVILKFIALHRVMPTRIHGIIALAALVAVGGCRPAPQQNPMRPAKPVDHDPIPRASEIPSPTPPAPSSPARAPSLARKTISGITFEGVAFDFRTHRLVVADQPNGPGTIYSTSADAAQRTGSLLAINAGFFTPEGKPLGLVVSGGKPAGAWNSASSLGNGIFKESRSGAASISRRSSRAVSSDAMELIQAGPLLIENGARISGLDTQKTALRSIILTDGGTRWWIGTSSSCTLAALGNALASGSPVGWKTKNALNLDGGRSTDLFISQAIPGGPLNRRGMFNRPVRNFLLLRPR